MSIDEVKTELFSLLMKLEPDNMSDIDTELLFQLSMQKEVDDWREKMKKMYEELKKQKNDKNLNS